MGWGLVLDSLLLVNFGRRSLTLFVRMDSTVELGMGPEGVGGFLVV